MKLLNYTQGRDNNFNLIRIIAAYAVLVTHSFAISVGSGSAEPAIKSIELGMGGVAVDIFFITSGFLVTASLLNRDSIIDFFWARILRIYPSLIVMLLLTTFGLGLFFTTRSFSAYISDFQTYKYLVKCGTLFAGISYNLPGVFENNPFVIAVNGSLWSMPWEVRMYAVLAIFWLGAKVFIKETSAKLKLLKNVIILSVFIVLILLFYSYFTGSNKTLFLKLYVLFFSGGSCYILRNKIELSGKIFTGILILLFLSAISKDIFYFIYILTMPYILFYLAYIPSGFIRKYNSFGDYSYGVYIFAFPIQQSFTALIPGISVLRLIILSTVCTFVMAYLSWHNIEKHMLRLKESYSLKTKKILDNIFNRTTNFTIVE